MEEVSTQVADLGDNTATGLVLSPEKMQLMNSLAQVMAGGVSTVPKHLQQNPSDCMAIVMQSMSWGMNPYAVAQKTHLVNGSLGYEAQLVNAVITASQAIRGRFHYEERGKGQDLEVRCGATIAGEDELTWGQWIKMKDQTVKNSPLWKTDPFQQMCYLATKKWARLYCPQTILGVYTKDELEDTRPPEREINPAVSTESETLKEQAKKQPVNVEPSTGEEIPLRVMEYVDVLIQKIETEDLEACEKLLVQAQKKLANYPSLIANVESAFSERQGG